MSRLLEGRKLLVTGAGRGIGAAAAQLFVEEGAKVLIASRTITELEAVAARIAAIHGQGQVHLLSADVSQRADVERLVAHADDVLGGVDGAFACAGVGSGGKLSVLDLDDADYDASFNANTRSSWLTVQAVARSLIARREPGSIVTTSSIASVMTNTRAGVYAAAKRAVDRLSTLAARELGPHGIRVNVVAPGATRTEMLQAWERQEPGALDQLARTTPLGRLGEPREVAQAAAWLLSERASYVSGAFLLVDGARSV